MSEIYGCGGNGEPCQPPFCPRCISPRRKDMTDNNWPDPARPGVPLNPERDGWHWLLAMYYDDPIGPPISCFWYAEHQSWPKLQDKPGNQPVSRGFCYLGPAFTPAERDTLKAENEKLRAAIQTARRDTLEEAADLCDQLSEHTPGICAIAIREMADQAKGEGDD